MRNGFNSEAIDRISKDKSRIVCMYNISIALLLHVAELVCKYREQYDE